MYHIPQRSMVNVPKIFRIKFRDSLAKAKSGRVMMQYTINHIMRTFMIHIMRTICMQD